MADLLGNQFGPDKGDKHRRRNEITGIQPCLQDSQPPMKTTTEPYNQPEKTRAEENTEDDQTAWANWVYPPEFYDSLSAVHLTEQSLAEHNRRNRLTQNHIAGRHRTQDVVSARPPTAQNTKDIGRFARHGGPDLMDIRNHGNDEPSLSNATTVTDAKVKRSTPYDANFEQHLNDHNVQATYNSQKPVNWVEIRAVLNQRRPSLTSTQFPESAFETFQDKNNCAPNEDTVMVDGLPTILGECASHTDRQASRRNMLFNNLATLTDGSIAHAKPDVYYGAQPEDLSRHVRDVLNNHIMPSTVQKRPIAPNFFVVVKGPDGTAAVANRQARFDGAIGSRAIHCLQNYGEEEPKHDGRAYTFSTTYHDGTLKIYTHHVTAPTSKGERPEYHVNKIRGFDMTDTRETFLQGVTAFRNARDLAKQHRDVFIQSANDAATREASEAARERDRDTKEDTDRNTREGHKSAEEAHPGQSFASDTPVMSTADSTTTKQTRRRHSPPASEVSVRFTRAAKRRRCTAGGL
ncbi:hypothetical protein SPBR_09163 [Sporothrix brasiliensis 5110]|uniref:DUF7924 domain-containing protein n=1 Tax=Sporothrix brasiliensis 5110 TaxID=1398154 RepID=A0A0C2J3J2_9PEZI|nr:uncharacterized protein SPBR_09163 [Sporothrix brasiliensis 5110]KIH93595.1 hypothetical protein SPBR_09163 [Sporothrix brasiliensis 5110]